MKINQIQVQNWIGAKDVDIKAETPAILVCGDNGAGKSSVYEAVRACLEGKVTRVKLKGDYVQLITDGPAKEGRALVVTDMGQSSFTVPKGQHNIGINLGDLNQQALSAVLDAHAFSKMEDKERRAFLFKLAGCEITVSGISERLKKKGVDEAIIAAIQPSLPKGMTEASKVAAQNATMKKGAWAQITGGTWGSVAGAKWQPTLPEFDSDEYERITTGIAEAKEAISAATQEIGVLRERIRVSHSTAQKFAEQKANVAQKPELLIELQSAIDAENAAAQAVTDAMTGAPKKGATKETRPDPASKGLLNLHLDAAQKVIGEFLALVGDSEGVAGYHKNGDIAPWDEFSLVADAEKSAKLYRETYAPKPGDPVDPRIKEANDNLLAAEQRVRDIREKLKLIEADEKVLAVADANDHDALMAQLKEEQGRQERLQSSLTGLLAQESEMGAAARAVKEAAGKKKDADEAHAQILAWDACAKALAPDGIPGDLVAEALDPFNEKLADVNGLCGWPLVVLRPDMSVLVGNRPYGLLSESEQWRADAAISVAVSALSGFKLLVLDRIDVLSPDNRGILVNLVDDLIYNEILESAVLFGTFKDKPKTLPVSFTAYWLAGGKVV